MAIPMAISGNDSAMQWLQEERVCLCLCHMESLVSYSAVCIGCLHDKPEAAKQTFFHHSHKVEVQKALEGDVHYSNQIESWSQIRFESTGNQYPYHTYT